jgi:hypothetical protein
MTRHLSVQNANYPSIVTLPVLVTTFSQRTAALSALDGMVAAIKG